MSRLSEQPHLQKRYLQEKGQHTLAVDRYKNGECYREQDNIAVEAPVALVYNGISHAVMLCTPDCLEEFAVGFSMSEGIVDKISDLHDVELENAEQGYVLNIQISNEAVFKLKQHRRNLTGRTGCGLCGSEALDHAIQTITCVQNTTQASADAIIHALQNLKQYQPLQNITGSVHGAAWSDLNGDIQLCREDVGRHNALDKLIGACLKAKIDFTDGFVVISSRASYEMIQKAGRCGIGIVVAVSAPTTLAIEIAEHADMMLAGFARDGQFVIYSHRERLLP